MKNNNWTRRDFLRCAGATASAPLLAAQVADADDGNRPPNIVLIFTDDQGYQDIGCYGATGFQTPYLDRMAREGCRFTDFYVAASVCSPSRAALLTGRYPPRAGVTNVLFPRAERGLPLSEVTIADVLKERGYATACFGKWHLGDEEKYLPTRRGFDEYFGIPYSNDMAIDADMPFADEVKFRKGATAENFRSGKKKRGWVPLFRNEEVVEYPANQSTLTKRYTRESVRFIRENSDNPFFLYVPHTMPHIPLAASEEFRGSSGSGLYGDVMQELDWSAGQILKTLQEEGLDENTLVIYTSDNGPWLSKGDAGGSAGPLRNGKFSTYEGGFRMPCIMRWPGRMPAGRTCGDICATIDLLPTFAAMADAPMPQDRVIDGKNLLPYLTGEQEESPRNRYFYYDGKNLEAMRKGRWKLRVADDPQLFDLRNDIGEQENLASEHPDRVERMRKIMNEFDSDLKS